MYEKNGLTTSLNDFTQPISVISNQKGLFMLNRNSFFMLMCTFVATVGVSTVAFAGNDPECTLAEVTSAALSVGKMYKEFNIDGISVTAIDSKTVGVHLVESYALWLTESNNWRVQLNLRFVVRAPGNSFYHKEGCGLIEVSVPPFQAP